MQHPAYSGYAPAGIIIFRVNEVKMYLKRFFIVLLISVTNLNFPGVEL